MSHKKLSPFIVKVSVLGYFPLVRKRINFNRCLRLLKYYFSHIITPPQIP